MAIARIPGVKPSEPAPPPQWTHNAYQNWQTLRRARPAPEADLYGVLDSAVSATLYERLLVEPASSAVSCLFDGEPALRYRNVAPYLIRMNTASPLAHDWLNGAWRQHWGIWMCTTYSIERLKTHLKKFLFVQTAKQGKSYFRFYDPRVLEQIMPIMNPGQRGDFFGLSAKRMPDALFSVVPPSMTRGQAASPAPVLRRYSPAQNLAMRFAHASTFQMDELPWQ